MNNNRRRVWVLIGLIVLGLGVFLSARLLSPAINNMVKLVLMGMTLIAIGIFIGAAITEYSIKEKQHQNWKSK